MTTRISRRTSSAASVVAARGVTSSCPDPLIGAPTTGPTNKVGRATVGPAGSATTAAAATTSTSGTTPVLVCGLLVMMPARIVLQCTSATRMKTSRPCPARGRRVLGQGLCQTPPSRSRVPHLVQTHRIKETAIATPATTWLPASTTVGTAASRRAFQPTTMTADITGTAVMIRTPAQPRNPTAGVPVGSGPRLRTQTTTFAAMKDAGRAVELAVPVTLKVWRAARQL